jgi:hypothetical protein
MNPFRFQTVPTVIVELAPRAGWERCCARPFRRRNASAW